LQFTLLINQNQGNFVIIFRENPNPMKTPLALVRTPPARAKRIATGKTGKTGKSDTDRIQARNVIV
jgi:hypothetical protein